MFYLAVCITYCPRVYEPVLFKMYGISHVTSTPRANSTAFDGEHRHNLSEHIFQRIFRRRKKIRRSLANLFSLSASSPWFSSTVLSSVDSSHVDNTWPDKCNKLEASQSDIGDSDFSSEYNIPMPQGQIPAAGRASLAKDVEFIEPGKPLCASPSRSQFMINGNEDTPNKAESNAVPNFLAQITALMVCLIISVRIRYFLGGLSATLMLIILVFLLSQDAAALSSFFSLVTSFKTTKFWNN
ncbi:transmembrane protein 71 [Cyrtonyx montezumae]|uniref:transmembrane protein 71 n=1 Tax=Cyrtonyx montezumae TaxID=9017 RepID=UPI0032D9B8A4